MAGASISNWARTHCRRWTACASGVVLGMTGAAQPCASQGVASLTKPAEFTLDQWTTVDGLPQNSVTSIAQTPDGYIWVGTFGGLARFDGLRFNVIERVDHAGRHVDRVLSLAIAPDSAVWVGTEDGLLRYRGGRFSHFSTAEGLPDNQILALHFDRSGTLWIGTQRGGARFAKGRFDAFREADGAALEQVVGFVEDRAGMMTLNTWDGFLTFNGGRLSRAGTGSHSGVERVMLEDREGSRWFRREGGVSRLEQGRLDSFHLGFGPEVMIEQDRPGRYWIGTFVHGLLEFRADSGGATTAYPLRDGTINYAVRALHRSLDGSVWVGTNEHGLLRLKRNLFTTYRTVNGLSHNVFTPVMESRDGSLWAGTNCGGVNVLDPARQHVSIYRLGRLATPGTDSCVFALSQDSSGAVWVGTWGGGLTRLYNGAVQPFGGLHALRDSVILAMYADPRGMLWVGTNAGGLAQVQDGHVRKIYTTADGLAHNSVRAITRARDGTLWIGTLGGLSHLGPDGRIKSYTAKDGLSSEYVRAIREDAEGTFWIGTYGGGLNRLRDGKFVPVTRADGLADNVVSSIVDDAHGNLWMSGNRGIFRVAKDQLRGFADGKLRHVHSVLYGVGDGLVNAETNGGFQPAAWKDHAGHLWFPTIDGLATVDPADASDVARPPSVTVEEIVVDGASQAPTRSLTIGPGRPNLEFRYSGVSLSSPEDVTFRYRLENLDDHWVEPGTRRVAYYSRLPAGRYRFLVTAANRNGTWNPVEAAMEVDVLAPLYLRPWFLGAMLLAVALALWLTHRAVLRTRSDAIRDERSRLAREIHDSLLQGFGGIALQLHAASARLALSPTQQPMLDRVLVMVDRTLKQAREAVWDIRPSEPVRADFAVECADAARNALEGSTTDIRVITRGGARPLSPASRTECLRIIEEALTNVRKHAGAAHATVEVHYAWRRLHVTITDDGKGFNPEQEGKRPGHWGWLGMRERASRIGGRLTMTSAPGSGTMVGVYVPYRLGWFARLAGTNLKD